MTTAPLPLSSPVAALLAAEGTRRGLPHPLVEQALADALRRSQASVGQAKARGPGVTVRLLAGMCSALGWRLVLSIERDASAVLADIVGPARAASVGRGCAAHGPWADEFPCGDTLDGCNRDSAARGAGESEE